VKVIAVPVTSGGNGLDTLINGHNQASEIAAATGGSLVSAAPANVAAAILLGLQNLPVTVTPVAVGCGGLTVSFSPASQTVTSGNNAVFTETITVDNNPALQGTTINCSVDFQTGFGTQSISITIPDTTPPTLTLPPDATNEATSAAGAVHTFNATATDNSDPNPSVVCNPPSGSTFPLGVTTITCTATDSSGNSTTGTFTKTVVDTTPPVLTVPSDATNEATGPGGAVHIFSATATDIVDPSPTVVCDPLSGSTFPLGDTLINCTATDFSGNASSGSFTKTVVDTTPPVASCVESVNPDGEIPDAPGKGGKGQNQDGFYQINATDIVDPDPQVFVVDDGTGFVFGPFPSGTNIKYTEANGAKPSQKPGSGAVDWKLNGQGDASVHAVDFSGNVSASAACLVPPDPK